MNSPDSDSPKTTSLTFLDQLRDLSNDDVWRRFLQVYVERMRLWLRSRRLDEPTVDDIIQQLLVVVVEKVGDFRHNGRRGAFRNWLNTILHNVLRETARRRQLASDQQELIDQLADPHDPLSDLMHEECAGHFLKMIDTVLKQLESDRQLAATSVAAFRLTALKGLSNEDAGEQLNMKRGAVATAKHRVTQRVRQDLAERLTKEIP